MSSGTDKAREKLKALLDIGSDQEFGAYCDLLTLAIKQHETLRGEHMANAVYDHYDAVLRRDYMFKDMALVCPDCLVLLMWEQMWEERTD